MKILLVHEFYRSSSPSGEDGVFTRERQLLLDSGAEVRTLTFHNDLIGTANGPTLFKTALYTPWSPLGRRLLREKLKCFKPDIVHFHNTFPVLTQAAIWEAKKLGAATVQTLHNYRWFCANGLLLRNGMVCNLCLKRGPWPAIRYRCYRNSLKATLPLVLNIALHRFLKTGCRAVDQIVVLTSFGREELLRNGLTEDRIAVKPNFFRDPLNGDSAKIQWDSGREGNWLFIGRLKEEKGVQFLPQVWERLGAKAPLLRIIGDGPMKGHLVREIRARGLSGKMLMEGYRQPESVQRFLSEAGLLVFPSVWYEGFPLTVGEAYAAGVPVAAARIGALQALVKEDRTGILFKAGDVGDMVEKLGKLVGAPAILKEMGQEARAEYEKKYTPSRNLEALMKIYEKALVKRERAFTRFFAVSSQGIGSL